MPTPVNIARQCLTSESAHALDEAVTVARKRGHAQTTSLHAVSALLSLPSSTLRDACARARNCAYSPRLQFKALELCLSVSLDRVSSSSQQQQRQLGDDDDHHRPPPPVSNSLMAAIKRSQANQRRQPENFHLYHQHHHQVSQSSSSSASSVAVVKVELRHLILSILDDPVVSRVFSEAGFRSSEIKLAVVRPVPSQLFKFSRSRAVAPPPMFLCDYENPGSGKKGLSFTFPGFGGFLDGDDENCRRIGDVLLKRKNPLLLGVSAYGVLKSFSERKNHDLLAMELSGLNIITIESDVYRFINGNSDKESLNVRFEEVGLFIEQRVGGGTEPGVVVNYGDLKVFVNEDNSDAVSYVVEQLTKLLLVKKQNGVKMWLVGAAASYDTYLKFVGRFSSIEKDWDLQLLPITSLKPSSMAAESYPRSSLMESFVPFGGFFSTPSDFKSPLNSLYQCVSRCHQCNEKCEQEISALSKGGFTASIADQCQSSLPSWLQMAELGTNNGSDMKIKDDGMLLSAKVTGLKKKWDDICLRLHHTQPSPNSNIYQASSQFPTVVGFRFLEDKKANAENSSSINTNAPCNENSCVNMTSGIPNDLENMSASRSVIPFPMVSNAKNESFLSKLWENPSKAGLESGGLRSPCSLSNSSVGDGSRASPTSVTTDLGLGMCSANELKKRSNEDLTELSQEVSGCFSANVDFVNGSTSNHPAQSSPSLCLDLHSESDLSNWKALFRSLTERVGWQDEAIGVISQTIAHCRSRNENCHGTSSRGDIWFNFIGPDKFGKRKIAIALAEIIYGSKENFICADLSSQDGMNNTYTTFDCQDVSGYSMKFRGKTVVDYVAGELYKKPPSVVFLENVNDADVQAQSSLSKAIRTGKFSDSHGREVSINNAIFVTTSAYMKDSKILSLTKEPLPFNYSEERILKAKSWQMQILIEPNLRNNMISYPFFVNKRKLTYRNDISNPQQHDISETVKRAHKSSTKNLDLNLPAEEDNDEVQDTDDGNFENDSDDNNTKSWLHDFSNQMVETCFKPFDFDALAEKILNDMNEIFCKTVGSECLLEIDSKVMEQILAAVNLSNKNRVVEDWLENVLSKGFAEAQKRYNLTKHSLVKLVTCEELKTPGVCLLPQKIILN